MPDTLKDNIFEAVSSIEKEAPDNLRLEKLAGDASDRRYYRLFYELAKIEKRLVVMDILNVENICKSEEVTLYHDDSGELPFINIHRFLNSIGSPVPDVLYFDRQKGLMLLQDIGDDSLLDLAENADESARRKLYKDAIDVLVQMQSKAESKKINSECLAFSQSFETSLLAWEFEHYIEYGIEALYFIKIQAEERKFLKKQFLEVCRRISELPRIFTHRDYHSRNLMIHKGHTYVIDFQDALYGPMQYDIVSLLRDSYIDIGDALREELLEYYVAQIDCEMGSSIDYTQFRKDFDLVALQRNLKAAGRFVFIDREKHNPAYLDSIPRTLSYVATDALRNQELAPLFEILSKYEPRLEPSQ